MRILWLQGPLLPARMYQALSPVVYKLELGAPVASWAFLGRTHGEQRELGATSLPPQSMGRRGMGNQEDGSLSGQGPQLVEFR